MVIMCGIASELGGVPQGMTRHILTPEEFFLVHRGLRREMVRTLVLEGQKLLFA